MKRSLAILLCVILAAFAATGSEHPFAGLSIKGYSVDSVFPSGFRSVRGKATIKVDNTSEYRKVSDIKATVYRDGRPFARGTCIDVAFLKGLNTYKLSGTVSLAEGVSVWTAIRAALSFRPSEYTVDVTLEMLHEDGTKETVKREDIPVTRFVKGR
ncbi:MAG: hypothetical protein II730_10795 [Bacteroidales bacterium]|nr:hypothetical protein [Bacteroidales bacterium]